MDDAKNLAGRVADLMDEFGLAEADLRVGENRVRFKKRGARVVDDEPTESGSSRPSSGEAPSPSADRPSGTPVASPMTGIFYSAPGPNAPAFAKDGDVVSQGQVVGLIEAMKVFNEITAPVAGTITKVVAANGAIVNPGEPLMYIG